MKVEFHEHMLIYRLRRGFKQSEMARKANISQGLLSQIEWGQRPVTDTIGDWFDRQMAMDEYDNAITPGEQFRLMVRRKGLNMHHASKAFQVSEATLLRWMRDEVDVPEWAWKAAA